MQQTEGSTQTNIPELLKAQGRSVAWFCRQVGIHRSYYWMMENGRRPLSRAYLHRAAEVLGVPASLLSTSRNVMTTDGNIDRAEADNVRAA